MNISRDGRDETARGKKSYAITDLANNFRGC